MNHFANPLMLAYKHVKDLEHRRTYVRMYVRSLADSAVAEYTVDPSQALALRRSDWPRLAEHELIRQSLAPYPRSFSLQGTGQCDSINQEVIR